MTCGSRCKNKWKLCNQHQTRVPIFVFNLYKGWANDTSNVKLSKKTCLMCKVKLNNPMEICLNELNTSLLKIKKN